MLKITLLGLPQITLQRKYLSESITGKRLALLVYLAVTGKVHSREQLADLLWADVSTRQAKKNLRDILPMLRQQVGDYLIITHQTIAFNRQLPYWLDVELFEEHLRTKQVISDSMILHELLNLYQGEFLGGFYVRQAPIFEEWVRLEREQLHKAVIDGLHLLADLYLKQADYKSGLMITGRLLIFEPWNEKAHQQQMLFFALSGQRTAALAQYATCQQRLAEEYGAAPLSQTKQLYEKIKGGTLMAQELSPQQSVNWDAIPNRVPLYGRQSELAQLEKWLMLDGCQLIGIFGIGGQGKSALIAQLIDNLTHSPSCSLIADLGTFRSPVPNGKKPHHFERIIWYSLVSPPRLKNLLAYFLNLLLPSEHDKPTTLSDQLDSLLACLRRQRTLLVLDHVEQIMQHGQRSGLYQPAYEVYGEFLRWVGKNKHHSCLILISREEPEDLTYLVREHLTVRTFYLGGISISAGVKMLREAGLQGEQALLASLVETYAGYPFALRLLIEMTEELQLDELEFFLEPLIFDPLRDLLHKYLATLSAPEYEIIRTLAMLEQPVDVISFCKRFAPSQSKAAYLSAQRSLQRRSLLTVEQGMMSLPKIILTYISQQLNQMPKIETFSKILFDRPEIGL